MKKVLNLRLNGATSGDAAQRIRYELNRADVGWYQVRKALEFRNKSGDFVPVNFEPFKKTYEVLTEKLQPMVYSLGFLKI